MANKNIFDLPASGAMVNTTLMEAQLTANGQNQKATLAQLLTFIQATATAFSQNINVAGNFSVGAGKLTVTAAAGDVFIAGTVNLAGNLSIGGGNVAITAADGSASFAVGNFTISAVGTLNISAGQITLNADGSGTLGGGGISWDAAGNLTQNLLSNSDIEITDTTKGYITKSPNGTRYRLKVDNAGNLGTEAA